MGLRYDVNLHKLDSLIANGMLLGKSVLMFGHCAATESAIAYLMEYDVKVAAIMDNNEVKHGSEYKFIPIVAPGHIKNFNGGNSIVLIAARFYEQMSAQLRGLGYGGRIERLIDDNSSAEYSLSDGTIKRKMERMLRGKETLAKIREKYPEQHLVVCPLDALGDAYLVISHLPEYQQKNEIANCVAVVNENGCRQVVDMFGVPCVTLNDEQMDEFVQAVIYTSEPNCILAHHDRVYTDAAIKWLNKHKMTFDNYYKQVILGLLSAAKQLEPIHLKPFENSAGIPRGKTVIIAPYAKSVVGVPNDYWLEMAERYRAKGFTICTNVYGNETALKNTTPITFPLNQAASAVEFAGTFIGIRSGLCDIINKAKCDKTVIFPDRYYSLTKMKLIEFWELKNWNQIVL